MHLVIHNTNKKKTILFIHGFNKDANTWNVTENGKPINIEINCRKYANTILLQLVKEDYLVPIEDIVHQTNEQIISSNINITNCTIVTHSNGSFYGIALSKINKIFSKLMLIAPTIKTDAYYSYLENLYNEDNTDISIKYKLDNFNKFDSTISDQKTVVRIHFEQLDKIPILSKMVNKNVKSRLFIHYNSPHMIHYQKADLIIDSIKEIIKC